jgi:DNA-binding NarL/FixJ family response regulator
MMPRRLLLVDDFNLVRAGLRLLVESLPDYQVVAEAGDGNEALRLIEELRPDVVLMDISMPGLNGVEATRRAVRLPAAPRVLILSMHIDKEYVRQALIAGAAGYLLKSAERAELELALTTVSRGEVWISPAVARSVVDDLVKGARASEGASSPIDQLTPRQREVLQLIAEGHSTKKIACALQLSVKTVEAHRAQIMQRLDVHHVAGLVLCAARMGLVST